MNLKRSVLSEMSRDIREKTKEDRYQRMKKALNFILPILLLACAAGLIFFGAHAFIKVVGDKGTMLTAPGVTTVEIKRAGTHDLMNHVRCVKDGVFRTFPEELPDGTKVSILSLRDGSRVPWRERVGTRQSSGHQSRSVSFGAVTFPEAGRYTVEVSGLPAEGRVFSIEESKFPQPFLSALFGLLGGIFLAVGAAIWLGIVVVLTLVNKATSKPLSPTVPSQS